MQLPYIARPGRRGRSHAALALTVVLAPGVAQAAEPADTEAARAVAGHSLFGHTFDEGPRQAAYLMAGMPKVHLPISCKAEPGTQLQAFFDQGVGQLHGFWFFEAERSFRQVAAAAPGCAMAYWGMAVANMSNDPRARAFIARASALATTEPAGKAKAPTGVADERERAYIEALAAFHEITDEDRAAARNALGIAASVGGSSSGVSTKTLQAPHKYTRPSLDRYRDLIVAMENLVERFPGDPEAKALLVFHIWDASAKWSRYFDPEMGKGLPISSQAAVDALAQQVLAQNPMHPIHHYVIHLWDGSRARRALSSAFRAGQSAPGIAHMWHMAGHTFSKLERHADAVYQQEASARVDHAYMARDNVFPDQIHNYGHNNNWLVESLAHVGRIKDALALARNLVDIPRHPRWNTVPGAKTVKGLAFANANDKRENSATLGRRRLFELLVEYELWSEIERLRDTPYLEATDDPEIQALRAHTLGLAAANLGRPAEAAQAALQAVLRRQKDERAAALDEALKKAKAEKLADDKTGKAVADAVERPTTAVRRTEALLAELGVVVKLAARTKLAASELDALLEVAKELPKTRLSRLLMRAGQTERALNLAQEAADGDRRQTGPLANLADLQARAGKTADAEATFRALAPLAARVDLDVPLYARLAPVAAAARKAQGLAVAADWRPANAQPKDLEVPRPSLDTLGPLFWSPPAAPDFELPDAAGKKLALRSYRGRPVVAVFYLGAGCIHCLEQLALFAPAAKRFAAAGISLVAVSLDSVAGLQRTFTATEARGKITFPVLSDEGLQAFKAFRAYDDFERLPLHGTFLIDGQGLIRWHDIGYEPFTQVDFLLDESKRLLRLPAQPRAPRPAPAPGKPGGPVATR
jgi:peroxiredoxin